MHLVSFYALMVVVFLLATGEKGPQATVCVLCFFPVDFFAKPDLNNSFVA